MARRRGTSPTQLIVEFFMTAPIAEIERQMEVATAIVRHRLGNGAVTKRTAPKGSAAPSPAPAPAPAPAAAAPAPVVPIRRNKPGPKPRAAKPAAGGSGGGVVRRRRPGVETPAAAAAAPASTLTELPAPGEPLVPDLPDQATPDED